VTLTEMRYVVALAQHKHFGKAAEACHVSQPTLSVAIKKVEGQLGFPLFERNASDIRITPEADPIIAQIKRVLEEDVKLSELTSVGRDPLVGTLRLGVIYTIAPYLLPQFIPALHARAPAMPLFIREDFTHNLIPALKQGELDVVILALPINEPGLVSQGVYDEDFRLIIPATHPWAECKSIQAERVHQEDLLLLGQGNCFRDQVLEACPSRSSSENLSTTMEGGSLETLRHMVASGAGMAVMPSTAADPLIGKESLIKVLPFDHPSPCRRVGLLWRVTYPRHQAIDCVKSAILACSFSGTNRI
jgi:LysR family transcriptional regulator, hydrogen peroxide-inducible genes activator